VIEAYLDELSAQLGRLGVRGRRRRRILAESEDHLRSDPEATRRFGDPAEIAQAFANDLGARGAMRAPLWTFAALAAAGTLYTALLLVWSGTGSLQAIARSGDDPALGLAAGAALVLAPQVGFATGVLGLWRALRWRGRRSVPAAEVRAVRRRTAIALVSGVATMGALGLFAEQFASRLPSWSPGVAVAGAVASAALLTGCGAAALQTATIRVAFAGPAGDIFDDLGRVVPAALRGRPWRFAGAVAAGSGAVVWLAGVVASDPYDGALRGIGEGAACFIGFAILSRFLALRS